MQLDYSSYPLSIFYREDCKAYLHEIFKDHNIIFKEVSTENVYRTITGSIFRNILGANTFGDRIWFAARDNKIVLGGLSNLIRETSDLITLNNYPLIETVKYCSLIIYLTWTNYRNRKNNTATEMLNKAGEILFSLPRESFSDSYERITTIEEYAYFDFCRVYTLSLLMHVLLSPNIQQIKISDDKTKDISHVKNIVYQVGYPQYMMYRDTFFIYRDLSSLFINNEENRLIEYVVNKYDSIRDFYVNTYMQSSQQLLKLYKYIF